MKTRLVVVDASAFIEALRDRGERVTRDRVTQLLAEDRLAVWEVTIGEVLLGARDERDYWRLSNRLTSRHVLSPPQRVWRRAARLGYEVRRRGHTVPLVDLATAVVAMHNDAALLHRDRHFALIAEACDLDEEYVGPPQPEG